MIIEEQRGEICPTDGHALGDLPCEECDHWKIERSGVKNSYGIEGSNEWCALIKEAQK